MVKLIALDLDGTLLTPQGTVTQQTIKAISTARAAGVRVVLNTGRPIPEALHFSRLAGCDPLTSCLGGAAMADAQSGEVIFREDIPEPSGTEALRLCLNRELCIMIFAGNEILLDPFSKQCLLKYYPFPVFHRNAITVDDPAAYMKEHGLPLTKLHVDFQKGQRWPEGQLKELPDVMLTSSCPLDFEVLGKGVDKGRMLERLAGRYGIKLEECAAVGDSDNDLGMLRVVGTPIAMGNAPAHIREIACRVSATNAEEGVAEAILSCINVK